MLKVAEVEETTKTRERVVTLRISEEILERIDGMSKASGRHRAGMIRKILMDAVAGYRTQKERVVRRAVNEDGICLCCDTGEHRSCMTGLIDPATGIDIDCLCRDKSHMAGR
jgi:hypothetical protein